MDAVPGAADLVPDLDALVSRQATRVDLVRRPEAFCKPTARRWWLATRGAGLTAHAQTATVPERLALRILLSPPESWRGSLASLLKPLTDGLVAAMHAHQGPVDPALLERAPTINPDLTRDEFRTLLEPTTAPLG